MGVPSIAHKIAGCHWFVLALVYLDSMDCFRVELYNDNKWGITVIPRSNTFKVSPPVRFHVTSYDRTNGRRCIDYEPIISKDLSRGMLTNLGVLNYFQNSLLIPAISSSAMLYERFEAILQRSDLSHINLILLIEYFSHKSRIMADRFKRLWISPPIWGLKKNIILFTIYNWVCNASEHTFSRIKILLVAR